MLLKRRMHCLILWVLLVALSFSGCASTPAAKDTLQDTLTALVSGDGQNVSVLAPNGTPVTGIQSSGIAQIITGKVTFQIISVSEKGKTATATLSICAPDAVALMRQALADMDVYDAERFTANMSALLEGDIPTVSYEVEVTMQYVDGQWCLVPNNELSNALSGGLLQEQARLEQAIRDAFAEE